MICSFLNKIETLEKDKIEQYLNFYSDARASFSNLDNVIGLLVHVTIIFLIKWKILNILRYNTFKNF